MSDELKVGQVLAVMWAQERAREPIRITDATITKLGRRWVHLDAGHKFDPAEGYPYELDGGDYGSPGSVFLSRQLAEEHVKVEAVWEKIKTHFRGWPSAPTGLTEAEIIDIAKKLGVDMGDES